MAPTFSASERADKYLINGVPVPWKWAMRPQHFTRNVLLRPGED
ncbi:hypothetical protein ABIE37_000350 [Arthrobacter bambusae]|uniref:Uncharacterized protein n=1 Tax=Arthrobacter bambusae TaxID=1338426 RepID=A0ABV2P1F8_9MICC